MKTVSSSLLALAFVMPSCLAVQHYTVKIPVNDYFKYHSPVYAKDLTQVHCHSASLSNWRFRGGILYGNLTLDPHFQGCILNKKHGFVGIFNNNTQIASLKVDRITSEKVPVIYARYFVHRKDTRHMPEAFEGIMHKLNPKYVIVNAKIKADRPKRRSKHKKLIYTK